MLSLPRKTSLRCSKCCASHAKQGGAQKHHSSPDFSRPLYEGAPSAAPATQNEPKMLQVLRLPRKTRRLPKASLVARLPPTSMEVLRVLPLPRKTSRRCSKCCACHAKRDGTQKHHSSPDFRRPLLASV